MKLLALQLTAFGCFTDTRLDFSGDGKVFHVIHGPNEAGKSTAMRALTGLLFGIPERTVDAHRHAMKDLRIGAELLSRDGAHLAVVRRKGRENTLLDSAGQPLGESTLTATLGGATADNFHTIFRLDHPTLIAGGADLAEGRGDLAQSLFQAGAGITTLRSVRQQLEDEARELFSLRGGKARINAAIESFKAAQRAGKESSLKPAEWSEAITRRYTHRAGVAKLRSDLDGGRIELRTLERQLAALPHARERAALLVQRGELGEVVILPENTATLREEAERVLRHEGPRREDAAEELQKLEPQLAALDSAPPLLTQAASIAALAQRLGEYRSALAELPDPARPEADGDRMLAPLAELDERIADQLARLGVWSGSAQDLMRLALPAAETVERFDERFAQLADRRVQLGRQFEDTRARIERNDEQIRALQLGGAVPTETDLAAARARRDQGWQLVRQAWLEGAGDSAEAQDFRGEQPLADAFEIHLRDADAIADRLRREAERVATLASLIAAQETARERLQGFERDRDQVNLATAELAADWRAVWKPGGLDPLTPREMRGWLTRHAALLQLLDQRRTRERELAAETARLRGLVERFARDAAAILATCAPELATQPPAHAVEQLQRRLTEAQKDAERRDQLHKRIERERKTLGDCERKLAGAQRDLATLCTQARCASLEDLRIAEERSRRARRLDAALETEQRALSGHAGGRPVGDFAAEIAGLDADALVMQIAELKPRLDAAEDERQQAQQELADVESTLKAMDGSATAAQAAEEAQAALARVRENAERFVQVQLAGAVLTRQIERYRRENQDPVLRRAGEVFPLLTRGSFAGVATSFDDKDRPIIVGVRPSGDEVDVNGMSEGTRDQLYLALRLASLERQLDHSEPLPFVVDDILVSFDDARACATLAVLAQLCPRTQVLFFTHHEHLVTLAESALPSALLQVHRLGQ